MVNFILNKQNVSSSVSRQSSVSIACSLNEVVLVDGVQPFSHSFSGLERE